MSAGNAVLERVEEKRKARRYTIGRVAVLGAGTMGARIAAHVANAGGAGAAVGYRSCERR